MSDDDVIRELDQMQVAFWRRIREVASAWRDHRPGNA
jgi:hypothetical protein